MDTDTFEPLTQHQRKIAAEEMDYPNCAELRISYSFVEVVYSEKYDIERCLRLFKAFGIPFIFTIGYYIVESYRVPTYEKMHFIRVSPNNIIILPENDDVTKHMINICSINVTDKGAFCHSINEKQTKEYQDVTDYLSRYFIVWSNIEISPIRIDGFYYCIPSRGKSKVHLAVLLGLKPIKFNHAEGFNITVIGDQVITKPGYDDSIYKELIE